MKAKWFCAQALWLVTIFISCAGLAHQERANLVVFPKNEGERPLLLPRVGKEVVQALLGANGKTTTSCRLENKCVVARRDLKACLAGLSEEGLVLEDREVKNLSPGDRAGTFTFYGAAVKFMEANHLPKTSIKLRIRFYVLEQNGAMRRSEITSSSAFVEIKIKNPLPEYPLSVHKYRLMLPDEDIHMLIHADPSASEEFAETMRALAARAHARDDTSKEAKLIDTFFEQIAVLATAEPDFIKPSIGISYFRKSKKYDEQYTDVCKKRFHKKKTTEKTRSYEITIDRHVRAYHARLLEDEGAFDLDKYFVDGDRNVHMFARYPRGACVVEFKQPDAIGYHGPGKIRTPDTMQGAQKILWQAFVGDLHARALAHSRPDSGKFFHVRQFLRIAHGGGEPHEESVLDAPPQ